MADFPFPKSPGGTAFGTVDRFKSPKTPGSYLKPSRSPGPLAYETASTLNFSTSTLSISSSQPSFGFREKFRLPGEAARLKEAGKDSPLHIPSSIGNTAQPSSRIRSQPAYSMGPKHKSYTSPARAHTPSPLDYTLPRPRVYEERRDTSLGFDDRFGDVGVRSAVRNPGIGDYDPDDKLTRTDTNSTIALPFNSRPPPPKHQDRSPGPCGSGVGNIAKDEVMPRSPVYSMGLKQSVRGVRGPLEPSPQTYQARSLYWTNKKELGKSGTTTGRARTAAAISLHKDVQGGAL